MQSEILPTENTLGDYQCQPLYVRKSHVEAYEFCPRQFYLQYVKCIDIEENYAMTMGTRFHKFADTFFDVCQEYPPSDWYNFIPSQFGSFEKEMATNFIDYEIDEQINNPYWIPIHREIELFHDELLISGGIDRIDWINPDENIVSIGEYKTSGKVDKKSLLRQLGVYKILVEHCLGYTVGSVNVINPRLKVYKDLGMPNTELSMTYLENVRKAYYNEDMCKPRCSSGRFSVCKLCGSTDEAGLYQGLECLTL